MRAPGAAASGLVFNEPQATGFIYAFPEVAFAPGTLKAVATKGGKVVAQQEIQTAGEPAAIKLTLHTGPKGLQADGSDVALIDFEVVDAQGRRCPTDEARVDFDVAGPVIWRGGFNAAKLNTTNNRYLDTECGINRVAIRSTLTPGTITVTAKREGLQPGDTHVRLQAGCDQDGWREEMPQTPVASGTGVAVDRACAVLIFMGQIRTSASTCAKDHFMKRQINLVLCCSQPLW